MVTEDLYLKSITQNNVTYSVDMLRLKTFISYEQFSEIEFRFNVAYADYVDSCYTSGKISKFFYNYHIVIDDDTSFWFGFLHNSEKRSAENGCKYNFTIEFNPNKLKDNHILMYLLRISSEWYLVSYDMAFDLKINILDVIYDQYLKRECKIFSYGMDNKTIMYGKGDGRTKIYNKKKESDLDINYDLTRVEVSRTCDSYPIRKIGFYNYGDNLPQIYLNKYLYTFDDYKDKTLLAILYAVQNGFPLKDLSRVYKERIKKLLQGGYRVFFDTKSATQAIRQVIFYYFIKDERIRWM